MTRTFESIAIKATPLNNNNFNLIVLDDLLKPYDSLINVYLKEFLKLISMYPECPDTTKTKYYLNILK